MFRFPIEIALTDNLKTHHLSVFSIGTALGFLYTKDPQLCKITPNKTFRAECNSPPAVIKLLESPRAISDDQSEKADLV